MASDLNVLAHRYADRISAVDVKLHDGLPRAYCEPIHLAQVLTNLIGNALEYSSGQVKVRARSIPDGWLEITVADSGPGLPPGSLTEPLSALPEVSQVRV